MGTGLKRAAELPLIYTMMTNPTPSAEPNIPPASNMPKAPTQLARVLASVSTTMGEQAKMQRELHELKATFHAWRMNDAGDRKEIMDTLRSLGARSEKAAESADANGLTLARLDRAFDFQLAALSHLSEQIEGLQQAASRSWSQRQREQIQSSWSNLCRDARGLSREDWKSARRVFLLGSRANRRLWLLMMGLVLVIVLIMAAERWW
jgi:hypothetical protein